MLTIGLLMIFSASAPTVANKVEYNSDAFFFVKRQLAWIFVGGILSIFMFIFPLNFFKKNSFLFLSIGLFFLLIIAIEAVFKINLPFVIERNGAVRWIDVGVTEIQIVEFIKLAYIIYASAWLTSIEKEIKKSSSTEDHVKIILKFLIPLGIVSLLVLAQRDLDTTAILVLTIFSIFFVAFNEKIYTLAIVSLLILSFSVGLLAIQLEDYRAQRFQGYLEIILNGEPSDESARDQNFQTWSGIIAIGSGGIFGKGYTESRTKHGFLQEAAYTDSIFAVIGEEFGIFGSLIVIGCFLYLSKVGVDIAKNCSDKFGSLVAVGITSWISIQAYLNIAANLSVIPFGGIPLPFLSYGGSSVIALLMATGLLLNISRIRNI
ncbi:MAG: cell division protein FtsW [Candidatus Dojkabacteria bacterium]|nr:MAG: cell division protein FtsW [Candidatus Dojkabacteria bacterium]